MPPKRRTGQKAPPPAILAAANAAARAKAVQKETKDLENTVNELTLSDETTESGVRLNFKNEDENHPSRGLGASGTSFTTKFPSLIDIFFQNIFRSAPSRTLFSSYCSPQSMMGKIRTLSANSCFAQVKASLLQSPSRYYLMRTILNVKRMSI
jgi:hypothetical protein